MSLAMMCRLRLYPRMALRALAQCRQPAAHVLWRTRGNRPCWMPRARLLWLVMSLVLMLLAPMAVARPMACLVAAPAHAARAPRIRGCKLTLANRACTVAWVEASRPARPQ